MSSQIRYWSRNCCSSGLFKKAPSIVPPILFSKGYVFIISLKSTSPKPYHLYIASLALHNNVRKLVCCDGSWAFTNRNSSACKNLYFILWRRVVKYSTSIPTLATELTITAAKLAQCEMEKWYFSSGKNGLRELAMVIWWKGKSGE